MDFIKKRQISQNMTVYRGFSGYCPRIRCGKTQWFREENLSSRFHPLLCPRERRRKLWDSSVRALGNSGGLMTLQGNTLHYGENALELPLEPGEKSLLPFGAYVIVAPDMVWVNTVEGTFGSCTHREEFEIPLGIVWCDRTGEPLEAVISSAEAPENREQYWLCPEKGEQTLMVYSHEAYTWVPVEPTYVRLQGDGIGKPFPPGSRILVEDCPDLAPVVGTGLCPVYDSGRDYLVLQGRIRAVRVETETLQFRLTAPVPLMDHLICHENRLWGCRYGRDHDGNFVNEIYASALGDFSNWYSFRGLTSDSYVLSLGEQGAFTGAAVVGGYPVFFKEHSIHKIYGTRPASYQLRSTICPGVAPGSHKSMVHTEDGLMYLGTQGFYCYDGSMPVKISKDLEGQTYTQGVGGALGSVYYCSVLEKDGTPVLLTYDRENRLWHRETGVRPLEFAEAKGVLYYRTATPGLYAIGSDVGDYAEGKVSWQAETGLLREEKPYEGYFTGLRLRVSGEAGSRLTVYAEYDSRGAWEPLGTVSGGRLGSRDVPFSIRKCDHLRLKLCGIGDMTVHTMTLVMEG